MPYLSDHSLNKVAYPITPTYRNLSLGNPSHSPYPPPLTVSPMPTICLTFVSISYRVPPLTVYPTYCIPNLPYPPPSYRISSHIQIAETKDPNRRWLKEIVANFLNPDSSKIKYDVDTVFKLLDQVCDWGLTLLFRPTYHNPELSCAAVPRFGIAQLHTVGERYQANRRLILFSKYGKMMTFCAGPRGHDYPTNSARVRGAHLRVRRHSWTDHRPQKVYGSLIFDLWSKV